MKQYQVVKSLNLPAIDAEILAFWEQQQIFQKSITERMDCPSYVFYEGPPSANGMPGIHHVMSRTVKDLFCRFHTMQGKKVERKGGWDTHGLPIELSVEKELGITKDEIGTSISVDDYNHKCRETVMRYKNVWDALTVKMGYWVDLDSPYITFTNEYIESVWHIIQKLYKKNYLYKGYTIQPYSPAAGTGLSSHELNQPGCYREVRDMSLVALFQLKQNEKSEFLFKLRGVAHTDVRLSAWTTTPWTLPSNTALVVGPQIQYSVVDTLNPYTFNPVRIVLASALLPKWFDVQKEVKELPEKSEWKGHYILRGEVIGSDLAGCRYHQLMAYAQPVEGDAFVVVTGDFVSTEDGTGIVHCAPSFGADDMRMAKQHGLGSLTLVNLKGRFTAEVSDFANEFVKEDYLSAEEKEKEKKRLGLEKYLSVDERIAISLKKSGHCFSTQKYLHSYPHCWRTDKPIIYYPLDSWFIKTTAAKEKLIALNKTINWKPASTGTGRFGDWLENMQDWNLSRSRFWGIGLPIWRNEGGDVEICIGSIQELEAEIQKANAKFGLQQSIPKDLHRPYIDEIILCGPQGERLKRELDLIDVWFDSGSMPYAQWHYPFENEEKFKNNYPADFIAEGVDQTRGWFYTLHAIAGMAFDSVAFKNVVSNGLVLDKEGRKMSKRLGNTVEPFETIQQHGADATRWYMIANSPPWENLKFDVEGIEEVKRKFFSTLFNTYNFFALYANIDAFHYKEADVDRAHQSELDRWILSRLNHLMQEVVEAYSDYEPTNAARLIANFVDKDLSNWYVRLSRRRYWKDSNLTAGDTDKLSAYQTLYQCLEHVAIAMAPVAPFFADWLFIHLNQVTHRKNSSSVHLEIMQTGNPAWIDHELEITMDYAQRIVSLILSLRKKEKIRVRQPLQKVLIPVLDDQFEARVKHVEQVIKSEVNIKDIEFVKDASGMIKKKVKPNFRTLGKKVGKEMNAVSNLIQQWTHAEIQQLEKLGKQEIHIGSNMFEILLDDVEIFTEDIPGWLVAQDGDITVALDVNINDALYLEGIAKEVVNRIQNLRKVQDLQLTDKIQVTIQENSDLKNCIQFYHDYISQEVLATKLELVTQVQGGQTVEWLNDETIDISIVKN